MGDFEKDIQRIFEEAAFQPSEQVWEGVEASLKSGKKRSVFVFWQNYGIAAAVVLFLSLGYLLKDPLFFTPSPPTETNEQSATAGVIVDSPNVNGIDDAQITIDSLKPEEKTDRSLAFVGKSPSKDKNDQPGTDSETSVPVLNATYQEVAEPSDDLVVEMIPVRSIHDLVLIDSARLESLDRQAKWMAKNMILKPGGRSYVAIVEEPSSKGIRLSGSLASGSFNPDLSSGASDGLVSIQAEDASFSGMSVRSSVTNEKNEPLNSFSVGAGVSFELGKRWSLRTGLQFSQYQFSNVSNAYSQEDGRFLPIYIPVGFDDETVFFVDDYKLTSKLTSMTVPAVFAYRFLDFNRWGFSAKLGLGVDYLMSYRIKGDLGFLETRKVSFEEQTLFNRVNLNALTGFNVNYELNDQLGLSGGVFFRKYISATEDESSGAGTSPALYGFNISVNYLIKRK